MYLELKRIKNHIRNRADMAVDMSNPHQVVAYVCPCAYARVHVCACVFVHMCN